MRVSVTEEAEDRLSMRRWTARTTDGGKLIFCDYDELERPTTRATYRVKRAWRETVTDTRYARDDGVVILEKPTISTDVRRKLLANARSQIIWAFEEQHG